MLTPPRRQEARTGMQAPGSGWYCLRCWPAHASEVNSRRLAKVAVWHCQERRYIRSPTRFGCDCERVRPHDARVPTCGTQTRLV